MNKILSVFMCIISAIFNLFGIPADSFDILPADSLNGGDPFIVETSTGTYYTYTTGGSIDIIKITDSEGFVYEERKTVFYAGSDGTVKDIWAPEIHNINGRWYIIAAAVFNKDAVAIGKMPEANEYTEHDDYYRYCFVLESKTDDIFGEYEFKSVLAPAGMNNIDGTYLKANDKLYFVTSSYKAVAHQCITITEMTDPFTLAEDADGQTVTSVISSPEFTWEKKGWRVNEGPAVLYKDNNIYVVYSASGFSSGEYALGMLSFVGKNIMNPKHWLKSPLPVHYNNSLKGIYNAGHCSFLYKDNGDIYMVYHATKTADFSKSPRLTFIEKVKFIDSIPVFM